MVVILPSKLCPFVFCKALANNDYKYPTSNVYTVKGVCLSKFALFFLFVKGFVAALMSIEDKDKLEYTKNSIEKNFSNYSAWHNQRCDLLFSIMSASFGI